MKLATILTALLMVFVVSAAADEWTGHISDSKCGARHNDHSEASINCVKACVKAGQEPVFVTEDDTVLNIANDEKVMDHLGHQVTITGELEGDTLTIDSVQHVAP